MRGGGGELLAWQEGRGRCRLYQLEPVALGRCRVGRNGRVVCRRVVRVVGRSW